MAASMIVTPYAQGAMWAAWAQGKAARLCLAQNGGSLTQASTTAQWDAAEISGNGYSRFTWTLPAGSYDGTAGRFQAPVQQATFTASIGGVGLTYNAIYLVLGSGTGQNITWDTGVTAIFAESPSVALAPGEPKAYNVRPFTDNIIALS